MSTRTIVAQFLQGLFVFPCTCLLGLMEALLFHMGHTAAIITVLLIAAIPLIGAIKTRQWPLTAGLLAGLVLSAGIYFAVR